MKENRNIQITKKNNLKENDLVAVRFDKGTGICLMKRKTDEQKIGQIIELPKFEKYTSDRKNTMHPVLKEEQRITNILKGLLKSGTISKRLYESLRPLGFQTVWAG